MPGTTVLLYNNAVPHLDFRPMYDGSSFTSKQQTPENEVHMTHYSCSRSFRVIEIGTNRKPYWYCNCVPIFYRFPDITIYCSKISVYPRKSPRCGK